MSGDAPSGTEEPQVTDPAAVLDDGVASSDAYVRTVEDLLALLLEEVPFAELLQQVIELAERAIDAADAIAVTVERIDGRTDTAAASDARSRELDELQRQLGAGPCVDAMREGEERHVADLREDERWPVELRDAAARTGLVSVVAVPLNLTGGACIGALNLFSEQPGGLDADARRTGRAIAAPVAATLANARAYHRVEMLGRQLREAIGTRAAIEQAKGILMVRVGCDEDEAFDLLRRTSQHQNRKLRDVAAAIVAMRDQLPPREG